eukprot:3052048-Amphidinium_carterae.1
MGLAFDIGWATVGYRMVKFIFPVFCVTCPKHIGECQFVLTSSISVCSAICIEHSGPRHSMSSVLRGVPCNQYFDDYCFIVPSLLVDDFNVAFADFVSLVGFPFCIKDPPGENFVGLGV